MLSDLGQQPSDERITKRKMSFDFETRDEDDGYLIQRVYTFSYAKEWDKWVFHTFEERKTVDGMVSERDWNRVRKINYLDSDAEKVDIPPEVSEELRKCTSAENVVIQT